MRKVVVLLLAMVLCLGLALSAGAIGASGTSDDIWYSALTFDTIEFIGSDDFTYTVPFPFNSGSFGDIVNFSFCDDVIYGYQGLAEGDDEWFPSIYGRILLVPASPDIGFTQSVSLCGGQQIINRSRVQDYYVSWSTDELLVDSVYLSGSYCYIDEREDIPSYYGGKAVNFGFDVPVVNGIARVGKAIYDYFYSESDMSYVFLDNIVLDLDYSRKSVDTASFDFNIPTDGSNSPNSHINFPSWMLQAKVSAPEPADDFNLGTWLAETVQGFIQVEIFPGFSIDKLFYVILVIGFMLWFFKVIS